MAKIVIISGIQAIDNPRVVKEADALAEAGHEVEVLAALYDEASAARTVRLMASRTWRHTPVVDLAHDGLVPRLDGWLLRARWRIDRWTRSTLGRESPGQLGLVPHRLYDEARARRADLYVSHLTQALWAGVRLAEQGRRVAVDLEDWYSEDGLPADRAQQPLSLMRHLEARLLRGAAYVTTTSHAMSSAVAKRYGIAPPAVIYNSFPIEERATLDRRMLDRHDRGSISITWFSQTIGPGRGLEALVQALSEIPHPFELHLRGRSRPGYIEALLRNAPEGVRNRTWAHPQVPQDELLSRLAEHDIGYCGELSDCASRDLTITNKAFEYMRAGLALIASDTSGQVELFNQAPAAVKIVPQADASALGRTLMAFALDQAALQRAKAASLHALAAQFDWAQSKREIQHLAATALGDSSPQPRVLCDA